MRAGRRSVLEVLVAIVGGAITFVLATAAGLILHVGLLPARRLAETQINRAIAGAFKGHVQVEHIGSLSVRGASGARLAVFDEEGRRIMLLDGIRTRGGVLTALASVLRSRGTIRIPFREVDVDHAEVLLVDGPGGSPSLARTFEGRDHSADRSGAGGRSVDLSVERVTVRHAWVHGRHAPLLIDAELARTIGSARLSPAAAAVEVLRTSVIMRGLLPGAQLVRAEVAGAATKPSNQGWRARTRVSGTAGEVAFSGSGTLDGKQVEAYADMPLTGPHLLRAIAPGAPIHDAVAAHVETRGTLPLLTSTAEVRAGPGSATASVQIVFAGQGKDVTRATADVDAAEIDLRTFLSNAPPSRLAASAHIFVSLGPRGIGGTYDLDRVSGTLDGRPLPPAHGDGEFTRRSLRGRLSVNEPGVPTDVAFSVHPGAPPGPRDVVVDFDARMRIADLSRARRLGSPAKGHGDARAHGRVNLVNGTIEAEGEAVLRDVARYGASLEHAELTGSAHGHVSGMELSGALTGTNARAGGLAFPTLRATANAQLGGRALLIRDAQVDLERAKIGVSARIAYARIEGSAVDLEGIVVEGLGEPAHADVRLRGPNVTMHAEVASLSLPRAARFLGNEQIDAGKVTMSASVELTPHVSRGLFLLDVREAAFGPVVGGAAHLEAELDGTTVHALALTSLPRTAQVSFDAPRVSLAGNPRSLGAWLGATGSATIDGVFDLAQAAVLLPSTSGILSRVRPGGVLHTTLNASRAGPEDAPDLALTVSTSALTLEEARVKVGAEADAIRVRGVDMIAHATLDGSTGRAHADTELDDSQGRLAAITVDGVAPLEELRRGVKSPLAILEDTPIAAHAEVPRRSLDRFPPIARRLPFKGEAKLSIDVAGTFRKPQVLLNATGHAIEAAFARQRTPVDVTLSARYDATTAVTRVQVLRPEGVLLDGTGVVTVGYDDLLRGVLPVPWEASASLRLNEVPLELLTALSHQGVNGRVSGEIELRGLHKDAALTGQLIARDVLLGNAPFRSATLDVSIERGDMDARLRFDQKDGFADVRATGGMQWGAELLPKRDETRSFDLAFDARAFRAAVLLPFVAGTFSQLDGRVDAHGRVHAEPNGLGGTMSGGLELRNGRFEIPLIGQEFHNVRGRMIMRSWGMLELEDISANGVTGRLTAQGTAALDGLRFVGAEAQIRVAQSERLPVTLEGVPMGDAWGRIQAKVTRAKGGGAFDVLLNVPKLNVELPSSAGHPVQSLDPDPNIRAGVHTPTGFEPLALGPPQAGRSQNATLVRIAVHLGDVRLRRGTQVNVTLQGDPIIEVAETTRASGQVRLTGGKIVVYGKQFEVERGTITFTGQDADNPLVVASAYWEAPEGTRVYADFTGPVKTGKLSLRSEPPHTQNEILAILLFGSPQATFGAASAQGQQPQQPGAIASPAAGIGGSVVAQGLNEALSEISPFEITTRVDTSRANNPQPQVQVQITNNVSVQASYNLGLPAPGDNPDRTLLMIDWRVLRAWTIETTIGDRGSTWVDLFWYYRY